MKMSWVRFPHPAPLPTECHADSMATDGEATIRVIDLGDPHAATLIDEACRHTGFLVVTNHGVDQAVIDTAWSATTKFFDLPIADKMAVAMPYRGYPYGYAPIEGERLAASLGDETPPDLKETFSMGPIDRPARATADAAEAFVYEPTPWPPALPELQPALRRTTTQWLRWSRASCDCSPTPSTCRRPSSTLGSTATPAHCDC